jgi:hypothetical protein
MFDRESSSSQQYSFGTQVKAEFGSGKSELLHVPTPNPSEEGRGKRELPCRSSVTPKDKTKPLFKA